MQFYYDKFKQSYPNVSKEEFDGFYSWFESEGFISLTARYYHEIYTFFLESKKNYDNKKSNTCAEIDTATMFDVSRSLVRRIKSNFVKNY